MQRKKRGDSIRRFTAFPHLSRNRDTVLRLAFLISSAVPVILPAGSCLQGQTINPVISTFLGTNQRNFYGLCAPDSLGLIWKCFLGKGITNISSRLGDRVWAGSGWTGQPLLVREDSLLFLVLGAFDHNLKKIDARDGSIVWQYSFDDVIKGTPTLWIGSRRDSSRREAVILQGSRRGYGNFLFTPLVPSFRAVSYWTGKELWRLNVWRTPSISRDTDGSALILGDSAFVGLENGVFIGLYPSPEQANTREGILQPGLFTKQPLYQWKDAVLHRGNLVIESSPCLLNGMIYITAGSGHVYGYDPAADSLIWDFFIGSDMDGSPVVTEDSCLLIPVEKEFIPGPGGVLKLDPSKPPKESVVWFLPTGDRNYATWQGGVIGSACVNDMTRPEGYPRLAACSAIDGFLYVMRYDSIDSRQAVTPGPDGRTHYPIPQVIFKTYIGPSISTPVLVGDKLIAASYGGLRLFQYNAAGEFQELDRFAPASFESTPIVYGRRIYIGSRDGYLYCLGDK